MPVVETNRSYAVEVDGIDKRRWHDIIALFDDTSLYQTWSYGSVHWGEQNLSHILLRDGDDVVAAAQARIMKLPVIKAAMAYVPWGPLWRRRDRQPTADVFRKIVVSLREEYVVRRGMELRLLPNEIDGDRDDLKAILHEEGFSWRPSNYRIMLLELSPSVDELRKNLTAKWRYDLKQSEKHDIAIEFGTSHEMYDEFATVYREMHAVKQFPQFVSIEEFRQIQCDLPPEHKMQILICRHQGQVVSGFVFSSNGEKGIAILGATNDQGRELRMGFLMQWKIIQWLKEHGARYYDLGGVDPKLAQGTYHFKAGAAGKKGRDVRHLGVFTCCRNPVSGFVFSTGMRLRAAWREHKLRRAKIPEPFDKKKS